VPLDPSGIASGIILGAILAALIESLFLGAIRVIRPQPRRRKIAEY
jgi:hypothetical protein